MKLSKNQKTIGVIALLAVFVLLFTGNAVNNSIIASPYVDAGLTIERAASGEGQPQMILFKNAQQAIQPGGYFTLGVRQLVNDQNLRLGNGNCGGHLKVLVTKPTATSWTYSYDMPFTLASAMCGYVGPENMNIIQYMDWELTVYTPSTWAPGTGKVEAWFTNDAGTAITAHETNTFTILGGTTTTCDPNTCKPVTSSWTDVGMCIGGVKKQARTVTSYSCVSNTCKQGAGDIQYQNIACSTSSGGTGEIKNTPTPTPSCGVIGTSECLGAAVGYPGMDAYRDCDDWNGDGTPEWMSFRCPSGSTCAVGGTACTATAPAATSCSSVGASECLGPAIGYPGLDAYRDCDDWTGAGATWMSFRCPTGSVCPAGETQCRSPSSPPNPMLIVGAVVALLLVSGGGFLALRRK